MVRKNQLFPTVSTGQMFTRVVEKAVLRGRFCRDQLEVHTQLLGVTNSN